MPTLAQLNAQSARTRAFLQNALEGGSIQRSILDPVTGTTRLLASSPFTETGRAVINNQSRGAGGATVAGASGPNVTSGLSGPSNLLLSSGTVSRRFDTSGVDSRGIPIRPSNAIDSTIQQSTSDLQPVLEELLAAIISNGGTPQAQQASAERTEATKELQNTIGALTPQAAQAASKALVDDIIRSTLDEIMPQLQAASESAGASQSALQTLQFNDLAARTAETAATVAVETITGFAQAQAGAGAVVERLTATDPLNEQLIGLITGTPTETSQSSGNVELLNALGLLPEDLDPAVLQSILNRISGG